MRRRGKFKVTPWVYVLEAVLIVALCCGVMYAENPGRFKKQKANAPAVETGKETEAATAPQESLSFDFSASGLLVGFETFGSCDVQVLSAEPAAIVYKSGKNLCGGKEGTPLPFQYKGITYVLEADGAIVADGTADGNSLCYYAGRIGEGRTDAERLFLPEGIYTLSGCPQGGGSSTYRLRLAVVDQAGKTTYYDDCGDGVAVTLREASYVAVLVQIMNGTTADQLKFYPQLEVGEQATAYEKYVGEEYLVKTTDGVGEISIPISGDREEQKYTVLYSNGSELTVSAYGTLEMAKQPFYHAASPHFAIIDDDGKDDVYSVLMPLLNDRGIAFSCSVIPSKLNVTGYLTVDQLRELEDAGNKVLCHSKNHINLKNEATTYAQRYEEIVGGKEMLENLGFKVDTMVYPNGSYDDEVLAITRSAYTYGIATSGETTYGEQRYNRDPINVYAIERINIGSYYAGETAEEKAQALAAAKENIDVCIENNYLCVIMTHIGDAGEDGIAQIVELIDYIEGKGYRIDDFDTAIKAHMQPSEG